LIQIGNFVCE
jgi:hypothetical protein